MKIKIENIFKNIFNKFHFNKDSEQAKVIKFSRESIDKINSEEENISRKRKGASNIEVKIKKERIPINKNIKKVFVAMVLLLILTTTLNIQYKDFFYTEEYQPKDISSVSVSSSIDNVNVDDSSNEDIEEKSIKATKAEEKVVTKKVEEKLVFSPPLDGEIQKMYSLDKVIYSKTLEQWKTHDGIDISADEGTEVKSIEKGIVDSVQNDSFYGTTIQIEHKSGYRSVYCNLDENVYVTVGESVVKGQKIGKVGNTSIGEYLDSPHLHFMLYLNEENIDPTYIFQ